ncbi:hypothetical protein CY35_05G010400 [Sphagnum magellanicum]|nr:hypothetical protein CY35_05G010400 [Sphagnum magellanicum]
MRLATIMAVPAALKAAIELGVFEILSKARGAGKISLTAKERLRRNENVVRESAVTVPSGNSNSSTERCYALQPVGTYFVRSDVDSASLAPLLVHLHDRDFLEPWHHLSATVLDDSTEPFRRAHGESAFQYISHNPRSDKIFNAAMAHHSRLYMQAVLRAYHGFQDVKRLVDVGGGVEHVGGDMFDSVPSGDAIFMKWILHDWNDSECVTILRNCFNALPASGGKVNCSGVVAVRIDLIMLAHTSAGAKERTLHEFRQIAKAAGFASVSVVVAIDFLSVLEFDKA